MYYVCVSCYLLSVSISSLLFVQDASEVPTLDLPPSSEDLPVTTEQATKAVAIYEVLRQFYKILRLSPFR